MSKQDTRIIVRKVPAKAHDDGGHGGWKVAAADFFTAMMAFFIVMWILGMDEEVKQSIESYFTSPVGHTQAYSAGASPVSAGASPSRPSTSPVHLVTRAHQERRFEEAAERIRGAVQGQASLLGTAHVEVVVADDGLRVELVESEEGDVFFPLGSAAITPATRQVIQAIAPELASLNASVVVEGHTDALPFGSPEYSNWELSAARANAARGVLQASGLGERHIGEVRGYADRKLRLPDDPEHPSNRRTSIFLPFADPLANLAP